MKLEKEGGKRRGLPENREGGLTGKGESKPGLPRKQADWKRRENGLGFLDNNSVPATGGQESGDRSGRQTVRKKRKLEKTGKTK